MKKTKTYKLHQEVKGYRVLTIEAKNRTEIKKGNYEIIDSDTDIEESKMLNIEEV